MIVEQLEPKRALMERIDAVRKPGSIVSSNTSGIPIAVDRRGPQRRFRQHFLGTHFFNPPRYLKLLEVIPTADTRPEVVELMRSFAEKQLGKGVVVAKDRPNFIANRIGTYIGQVRMNYALEHGYSVEEVDTLTGPLIGNPKTATFRLVDLVGLDVMAHVTDNLYEAVPEDESRETFQLPQPLTPAARGGRARQQDRRRLLQKDQSGAGSEFWPLNLHERRVRSSDQDPLRVGRAGTDDRGDPGAAARDLRARPGRPRRRLSDRHHAADPGLRGAAHPRDRRLARATSTTRCAGASTPSSGRSRSGTRSASGAASR